MENKWIIIIPVVVVAFYLLRYIIEKKRAHALQQQAARHGFRFSASDSLSSIDAFKIMDRGRDHRVENFASKQYGELVLKLFEYRFVTGHGKGRRVNRLSVCQLRDPELKLPKCFIRRQSALLDRLGSALGGQDIDFDEDPEFSKAFVWQGGEEAATRALFGPRLRRYFGRFAGKTIMFECHGSSLCLHRNKRFSPNKVYQLISDMREIHKAVKQASEALD